MPGPTPPTTFNLADAWEFAAGSVPDREALVCGDRRLTYAALDERANRVAAHLAEREIGAGDTVAIFAPNCTEWLESMIGAWKIRALPFNANHRYSSAELGDLLDDAGAVGLVFDRALSPVVAGLGDARLARLRTALAVQVPGSPSDEPSELPSGAEDFDAATDRHLGAGAPVAERSGDDRYLLYTGGTTGKPKGVLWRHEDAFFACFGGGDPMRMSPVTRPEELADHIADFEFTYLCIAPLMHAAGQWVAMSWLWAGCRVVLQPGSLDPEAVWDTVDAERVNLLTVVGDAVGKPLLDTWEANPGRWQAATLFSISNGGAPISATLKARIAAAFPSAMITDGFGSSETGAQGSQRLAADTEPADAASSEARRSGVAHFSPYGDSTAVLTEDLEPVRPGSGETGRVALRGRIPIGYLGDPVRTAETFVEHAGSRWVLTGDFATVEADGTINLLGRGSQCINTGGEKVFSEEVEMALQGHPDVADVVVVGVDDERWGQAVCAVVQAHPGASPDLDDLRERTRAVLAGYKLPKRLVLVDEIVRSPAGKADYRWAHEVANRP
jgi:acyl-CoA synthetase (AMP-forming)/AMP-acid ligase II